MIVGAAGFIVSLLWMTVWAGRRNRVDRVCVVCDVGSRNIRPARGV